LCAGIFFLFSVGQPFQGAYLEINKNPKYKKLKDAIEEKIIIAEVVNKINRANGKVIMLTFC
jgi:myosin-1